MCEALRELMKDEIEKEVAKEVEKEVAKEVDKEKINCLKSVMEELSVSAERAMEILRIPQVDRPMLLERL